jgi:hypothetical protein
VSPYALRRLRFGGYSSSCRPVAGQPSRAIRKLSGERAPQQGRRIEACRPMSDSSPANKSDALSVACKLVGRFQYHFSQIEAAMNRGIAKVLDLNEGATDIVCANLDFVKKLYIIRSAVALQFEDKDGSLAALLKKIEALNSPDRQTVIHSTFEPHADGVRFVRVVARNELDRKTIDWDKQKFVQLFTRMDDLAMQLVNLVENLEPYVPKLDFSDPRNSMYLGFF